MLGCLMIALQAAAPAEECPSGTAAPAEECPSGTGFTFIPSGGGEEPPQDGLRYHATVKCEHSLTEVTRRLPLELVQGNDDGSSLSDAPFFQSFPLDPAPGKHCFRAVVDDVFGPDVVARAIEALEPVLRDASWKDHHAVTPVMLGSLSDPGAQLLREMSSAVTALVQGRFGAGELTSEFIVLRAHRPPEEARAPEAAAERRRAFSAGEVSVGRALELRSSGFHPHIDNAYMPSVAYTCLLYLTGELDGGETIMVDRADETGTLVTGLGVAPRAGRAFVYTSGPENVHGALPSLSGQRMILQWWLSSPG